MCDWERPNVAACQRKVVESAARGRPLAVLAWQRKIETWKEGIRAAVEDIGALPFTQSDAGKLACGMLYICEGGRYPATRHLAFANTDPRMIRFFLLLLRRYFSIDEAKLRVRIMHRWDQDGETLGRFWSRATGIPSRRFYRPYRDRRTRGKPTRRKDYHGICHLQYFDTTLQYQLQAIGESALRLAEDGNGRAAVGDAPPGLVREPPAPRYRALRFAAFPERDEMFSLRHLGQRP